MKRLWKKDIHPYRLPGRWQFKNREMPPKWALTRSREDYGNYTAHRPPFHPHDRGFQHPAQGREVDRSFHYLINGTFIKVIKDVSWVAAREFEFILENNAPDTNL